VDPSCKNFTETRLEQAEEIGPLFAQINCQRSLLLPLVLDFFFVVAEFPGLELQFAQLGLEGGSLRIRRLSTILEKTTTA
jgi:hypothetical protein